MKKEGKPELYTVKGPMSLMDFLQHIYAGKGKSSIKKLLQKRCVYVDGKISTKATLTLNVGQKIEINKAGGATPEKLKGLKLLHEDADIIVVDKPSGMLTMGTQKDRFNTAYRTLSDYVKRASLKNRIFIVHRLDRDTSGILVFAKNEAARNILQDNWHSDSHDRKYFALVSGQVEKNTDRIESWLKEHPKSLQVYSSQKDCDGLHSITNYTVISQNKSYSLLKVEPETGRKNQIRVHLSDISHPIVGDKRYGKGDNPIGRLGLHASLLTFEHPTSKKLMTFNSSVDKAFEHIARKK